MSSKQLLWASCAFPCLSVDLRQSPGLVTGRSALPVECWVWAVWAKWVRNANLFLPGLPLFLPLAAPPSLLQAGARSLVHTQAAS